MEGGKSRLFAHDLDKNAFGALPIELTIKDLFPGAKIKLSLGNSYDDFPTHNRAFQMCVGIVFGSVVAVLAVGFFGSQMFEPFLEVGMESRLIVVNKDRSGNVHGID